MKRVIALLLTLAMALSLCACGGNSAQTGAPEQEEKTTGGNVTRAEDIFAVEQIAYQERRSELQNFDIKIRNVTQERILDVYFGIQALDAAGDVLESWTMGSMDALEAGQGYWYYCNNNDLFGECATIEEAAAKAESIRIPFAKIQTVKDDPSSWVQYDFQEPPTFRIAEIPLRGLKMNEVIVPTEATVPTGPRVIGPQRQEGKALIIEDVTVEFLDQLPGSFTGTSTYSVCGNKEDFVLNDSQVYAAIHFTITNQTSEEVKLTDLDDDFTVELVYDGTYTYKSNGDTASFFLAGSQSAVVYDMSSIGVVSQPALVTMDMTVFLSCSRQVADNTDKILDVVFTSRYDGPETYTFAIR